MISRANILKFKHFHQMFSLDLFKKRSRSQKHTLHYSPYKTRLRPAVRCGRIRLLRSTLSVARVPHRSTEISLVNKYFSPRTTKKNTHWSRSNQPSAIGWGCVVFAWNGERERLFRTTTNSVVNSVMKLLPACSIVASCRSILQIMWNIFWSIKFVIP